MAVKATASSTGKKNAKAGSKIVPSPNPEKKVRHEAKSATIAIIKYSKISNLRFEISNLELKI